MSERTTARATRPAHRWAARWAEIEQITLPANLDVFLRENVERYANQVLLDFFERGRTVTYSDFSALVDCMFAALVTVGVQPGDRVSAVMRSVPEFPATMLALARMGATIVPTNYNYTASEFEFVASDAEVAAVVIADEFCDGVASASSIERLGRERVIVVGDGSHPIGTPLADLPDDPAAVPRFPPCELDDTVSFQYTSGTTGFPKGCRLTHRYWLEAMVVMDAVLGPRMRVLEDKPWFYMSGPISFFQAMACGGAQVIPDRPSLSKFLTWLREQRIDFAWFPKQLIAREPSELDKGHALRDAWTVGVSPQGIAELAERFGVAGRDCYGMTEIGIGSFVAPEDREGALNGSMGITAPFRETKVVDDDGDDVPVGDVGHLCVRGAGILRGYHNRPEANAELFLEHGWFQTGDLARFDPDGYVYYSGRVKDTIRRSGENIAAAEVEAVVVQVEGVTAAAAVPVPDDYRGEEVKVYVVLDEGRTAEGITPALILDWCGQRLAAFKVPRYVEYIDELPMTASGKVSKRHLKDAKDDLRVGSYDRVDVVWR